MSRKRHMSLQLLYHSSIALFTLGPPLLTPVADQVPEQIAHATCVLCSGAGMEESGGVWYAQGSGIAPYKHIQKCIIFFYALPR